jgi:hypothetical protein
MTYIPFERGGPKFSNTTARVSPVAVVFENLGPPLSNVM